MKKKFFVLVVLFILLFFSYRSYVNKDFYFICELLMKNSIRRHECIQGFQAKFHPSTHRRITLSLSTLGFGKDIVVEVVSTPESITKGLGYRDELGSDGMLFLLPQHTIPSFWMKGMRFPLDFVWIDGTMIIDLTENVPHQPGVADQDLSTYSPKSPVDKVLELPAGDIKRLGITIGDKVVQVAQ